VTDPTLRRIAAAGQHEIEIRKSRFICSVARVETDEDGREFIAATKKRYWDASHNCSAYVIGERGAIQRSSDDGEPSGTAGVPMLEVLRKMHLTDTVAVVTRYFGGTLLGAGGLIRAYGHAVSETIRRVGIVQRQYLAVVAVRADHATAGRLHNALETSIFPAAEVTYDAAGARFVLHLAEDEIDAFSAWVQETTNGTSHAIVEDHTSVDVAADIDLPQAR
jgi:uncharacterized YigZ family protein